MSVGRNPHHRRPVAEGDRVKGPTHDGPTHEGPARPVAEGDRVDGPTRTCIGCRRPAPRKALLRFADVEGRVTPDPAAVLPGRGAWLHPSPQCLELAIRRRAFPRALRSRVEIPHDTVDFIRTWPRSASTS
ncbi:MAG: YlxR family protein [Solirubrobacteraceae bacterium]